MSGTFTIGELAEAADVPASTDPGRLGCIDGSRGQLPRVRERVHAPRNGHCLLDEITETTIVKKTPTLLASLACFGFFLSACTTTYRESDFAGEPLDEPTGKAPNCSILANEPGCEVESPFDARDEL
jgi:hypothetical protein